MNAADARYLLVGGHAIGLFARPRATKDFDLWLEASADNATRVVAALRAFGAPIDGVRCHVIAREDLIANKRAAGRPQDLADVRALERTQKK